jgi:hypothetical protein
MNDPKELSAMPRNPDPHHLDHWFTKAAGVTFGGRQKVLQKCRAGEPLVLVREENNKHDPNAVAIKRETGEEVGYIPGATASTVARKLAKGIRFTAFAVEVTGGGKGESYGLNILMVESGRDVSKKEIRAYADGVDRDEHKDSSIPSGSETTATRSRPAKLLSIKGCGCIVVSAFVGTILIAIATNKGPIPASRPTGDEWNVRPPAPIKPTPRPAPARVVVPEKPAVVEPPPMPVIAPEKPAVVEVPETIEERAHRERQQMIDKKKAMRNPLRTNTR